MSEALAVLALALAGFEDAPRYTLTTIDFDIKAADEICLKKAGMLCLPAGKVRFSELGVSHEALVKKLSLVLADAGVAIKVPSDDDFDQEVRSRYRLTASIAKLKLNACMPWRGWKIGGQAKTRLDGRIAVVWRIFDQKAKILTSKISTCASFKADSKVDTLSQATDYVIANTARDVAPVLSADRVASDHPTGPVEVNMGCDAVELAFLSK